MEFFKTLQDIKIKYKNQQVTFTYDLIHDVFYLGYMGINEFKHLLKKHNYYNDIILEPRSLHVLNDNNLLFIALKTHMFITLL